MAEFDVDGARKAGYSDDEIATFVGPQMGFDVGAARKAGYSGKEILDFLNPQRTWGEFGKDMAIKAGQGVIGLGQSVVGLGDIVSGGLIGDGMKAVGYEPKRATEILGEFSSDKQKRMEGEIEAAGRGKGLIDGFADTLAAIARKPSSIPGYVAESLPSLLAAGGGARMLGEKVYATAVARATAAGAPAAEAALAGRAALEAATGSLKWAAAAGEGALTAGQIADQAREAGRAWSDYVLPALGAGIGTAAIGRAAGSIPGMGDAETAVFTKGAGAAAGNRAVRAAKGLVQEGVLEELPQSMQEQVWQNIAQGKPFDEGVGAAGAQGLVAGTAMGAGMGALSRANTETAKKVADQVEKEHRETATAEIGTANTVDQAVGAFVRATAPAGPLEFDRLGAQGMLNSAKYQPPAPPAPVESMPYEPVKGMMDSPETFGGSGFQGETVPFDYFTPNKGTRLALPSPDAPSGRNVLVNDTDPQLTRPEQLGDLERGRNEEQRLREAEADRIALGYDKIGNRPLATVGAETVGGSGSPAGMLASAPTAYQPAPKLNDGIVDLGRVLTQGYYSEGYPWQAGWKQESGSSIAQNGEDILKAGDKYTGAGMKLRDAIRHAEIVGDQVPDEAYRRLEDDAKTKAARSEKVAAQGSPQVSHETAPVEWPPGVKTEKIAKLREQAQRKKITKLRTEASGKGYVAIAAREELQRRAEVQAARKSPEAQAKKLSEESRKELWRIIKAAGGIHADEAPDIGIDARSVNAYKAGGLIGKSGGLRADLLASLLQENGYLTQQQVEDDGDNLARQMVADMLAKEVVGKPEQLAEIYGRLSAAHTEAEIKASGYDALPADEKLPVADFDDSGFMEEAVSDLEGTEVPLEVGMRAMGFTEQEIQDAINRTGQETGVPEGAASAVENDAGTKESGGSTDGQPAAESRAQVEPEQGQAPDLASATQAGRVAKLKSQPRIAPKDLSVAERDAWHDGWGPASLDNLKVEMTAIDAETGDKFKIQEKAGDALSELDAQIKTARGLLECLQ